MKGLNNYTNFITPKTICMNECINLFQASARKSVISTFLLHAVVIKTIIRHKPLIIEN